MPPRHTLQVPCQCLLVQYIAHLVYTAEHTFADLSDRLILDLGCGCGMLGIAATLMGCSLVIGVDADIDALNTCIENINAFEDASFDLILGDARDSFFRTASVSLFDSVVMNPPFGTKNNAGIDMQFLKRGLSLAQIVYSLHKSSTRLFILRKFPSAAVIAAMRFELPAQYRFHQKDRVDVEVDLIRTTS